MFTVVADADVTSWRRNVTSLVDMALTLRCPLAALKRDSSLTTTTWQKRDGGSWRQLPRDGGRVSLRPGASGDLRFNRLLVSDAGFYRCSKTTSTGVDNHSAPTVLIVHGMARSDDLICVIYARQQELL